MTLRRLCTLLLPLVAACGGGSSSSIDKTQFAAALAKAQCTMLLGGCCTGTSGAPTEADCEMKLTVQTQAEVNDAFTDVNVGYDANAAGACVAQYNSSAACGLLIVDNYGACNNIFIGTLADGAACTISNFTDCKSQLCGDNTTNTSAGTCIEPSAVGAACINDTNSGFAGNGCATGSHQSTTFPSDPGCICKPNYANGTACDNDGDCLSQICDPNSNVCVAFTIPTLTPQICATAFSNL